MWCPSAFPNCIPSKPLTNPACCCHYNGMRYAKFYIIVIAAIYALAGSVPSSEDVWIHDIDSVNTPYSPGLRRGKLRTRATCPGKYTFGIPLVDVVHHRSRQKDTIYIAAAVSVESGGKYTMYHVTKSYGKHGNGNFSAGILFSDISVGDNDVVIFSYLIVNAGHGSEHDVKQKIEQAVIAVVTKGAEIATSVVIDDLIPTIGRIIGLAFDNIIGWIIGFIGAGIAELVKEGCDGYLAAGVHAFSGEQICSKSVPLMGTDVNKGTSVEKLFGFIPGIVCSSTKSVYDVDWFVQ